MDNNIELHELDEKKSKWLENKIIHENKYRSNKVPPIDFRLYIENLIDDKMREDEKLVKRDKTDRFLGIGMAIIVVPLLIVLVPMSGVNPIYKTFIGVIVFTLALAIGVLILLKAERIQNKFDEWKIIRVNTGSLMALNGTVIMGILVFLSFSPSVISTQGTDNAATASNGDSRGINASTVSGNNISMDDKSFLNLEKGVTTSLVRSLTAGVIFQFVISTLYLIWFGDLAESAFKKKDIVVESQRTEKSFCFICGQSTSPQYATWGYKLGIVFAALGFILLSFTMLLVGLSSM